VRVAVKLIVTGRVQGVSFRAGMYQNAVESDVDGWVRNLDDGSVEALLQGDEGDVRRVVDWARTGPPGARVSTITETVIEGHPRLVGFRIVT